VNFSERRRSERFSGEILIELKQGKGLSRDFSTDGVYFVTDQPLTLGEQLDFVMHLTHADPAWPILLQCRGEVVRLEAGLKKTGVAVAIATHRFERKPAWPE
jgi:hypothetical protein